MDLSMGLLEGAFSNVVGVPEISPLALIGRFPSFMSRFPYVVGRCLE